MNFFLKALTLVCFLAVSCSSLTAQEIASPSEDAIEKQATEENPILQTYSWLKKIVDIVLIQKRLSVRSFTN